MLFCRLCDMVSVKLDWRVVGVFIWVWVNVEIFVLWLLDEDILLGFEMVVIGFLMERGWVFWMREGCVGVVFLVNGVGVGVRGVCVGGLVRGMGVRVLGICGVDFVVVVFIVWVFVDFGVLMGFGCGLVLFVVIEVRLMLVFLVVVWVVNGVVVWGLLLLIVGLFGIVCCGVIVMGIVVFFGVIEVEVFICWDWIVDCVVILVLDGRIDFVSGFNLFWVCFEGVLICEVVFWLIVWFWGWFFNFVINWEMECCEFLFFVMDWIGRDFDGMDCLVLVMVLLRIDWDCVDVFVSCFGVGVMIILLISCVCMNVGMILFLVCGWVEILEDDIVGVKRVVFWVVGVGLVLIVKVIFWLSDWLEMG